MALSITQQPRYKTLPAAQPVIFTVSDASYVAANYKIKYVAEVYISTTSTGIIATANKVATLKTSPNGSGVGIFDLRSIIESYVSPDYTGAYVNPATQSNYSKYKTTGWSELTPHPIHLIDKYCCNSTSARYFAVRFKIEGATSQTGSVTDSGQTSDSDTNLVYNGYIKNEDELYLDSANGEFGYNLETSSTHVIMNDGTNGSFLTNAPKRLKARLTDYGTMAFFNHLTGANNDFEIGGGGATTKKVDKITIELYDSSGSQLGTDIDVTCQASNGGSAGTDGKSYYKLQYFGCYPANLDNWNTTWDTHKANVSYYTIQAYNDASQKIAKEYRIDIIEDCKFDGIRLAWVNKYGVWDYYTFNMKSSRSLTTKRTPYTQIDGTWNDTIYRMHGYQGGEKNFRVNTKEKIKVNTDFISEAEAVWFEELIASPEVYILNGFTSSDTNMLRKFVEPVTLTTTSYTRKTKANDKLIQYTFEVERTKNNNIQSI